MLIEKKDAHAAQVYVAIFTLGMFDKSVQETHLFPKPKIFHDIVAPQLAKTKQHPVDPLMAAKRVHKFLVRAVRRISHQNFFSSEPILRLFSLLGISHINF